MILTDNPENQAAAIVTAEKAKSNDNITISLCDGGGYMTRFTLK